MIAIEVRSKSNSIEREVRRFAERRVSFALDRLRNLRRIAISIEDVNGPKGGADKRCRIVAEFAFTSIVLEETRPSWESAVTRAFHRVTQKASRDLQRVNRSSSRRAHRSQFKAPWMQHKA
jgi:hypothetical protein